MDLRVDDGATDATAAEDAALGALLSLLRGRGYRFVTPHNGTIALVRERPDKGRARDLRDMLGWSLPFAPGTVDEEAEALLARAGRLEPAEGEGLTRATVRVSTVGDDLFLHSAYPTRAADSVFLGPDTYRFAEFLRVELAGCAPVGEVLDIGTGAGVGGVVAARLARARLTTLSDVNAEALRLARVNAAAAGVAAATRRTSGVEGLEGRFDIVVSNPPFIAEGGKVYSDGGGMRGAALSLDWAQAGMGRLSLGGRLLMYTGSPIVAGRDPLREALETAAAEAGCAFGYRELDPDIFGGLLDRPVYREVERIAAVGITLTAP